jgi:hypothetical protein
VGAEIQSITYNEFLPALMGSHAPATHSVSDPEVNASVQTEFSAAFFRVGHTMLSTTLARVKNDGSPAPGGGVPLRDAFFVPNNIANGTELGYFLKGLASQRQQEVDNQIVDDVRDFLFGEPMPGGFDLAALNIQRGRDHGLPDYNTLRVAFGLPAVSDFEDICSDPTVQAKLASLYPTVNDIDPWVGALSEDHLADAGMGALLTAALNVQFTLSRDGDRYWYKRDPDLSAGDIAMIDSTRLSDIIRRNSDITNLQTNVFFVPEPIATVTLALTAIALVKRQTRTRR